MTNNKAPNQENLRESTSEKDIYYYYDENQKPVLKTKEIFKNTKLIIFYPYSVSNKDNTVKAKRIRKIEFVDWSLDQIPNDFKTEGKYGLRTLRARSFFSLLYSRYKEISEYKVGPNIQTSFKKKSIQFKWSDLKQIFNTIQKEKLSYDRERNFLISKELAKINKTIVVKPRLLPSGDLSRYLSRFDSYTKVSAQDLSALSGVLDLIPPSVIETTSNFLRSKDKINEVYLEDVINKYEKLLSATKDNEKQWQDFFEKNTWVLSHLFPYEVIIRKREAFVGGKTIENDEGRIVDFLFTNGFTDNFVLIEIKTHKKELLKKVPYRKPSTFCMSDDLSGGIAQCLDQKDTYVKDFGNKYPSFDPKCILIVGRKDNLNSNQKNCFELLRANQSTVDIVTFDELFKKLQGLLKVISYSDVK
ncbi:Shedu immune nuclease family protein [Sphingobacterium sp. SGR-19]|uniref:Shedu immune nuclease family protein n=1 Tax=Sphingobacterium sp. SGR-19 TaxID=2710886 RepID=UPI0013E9FEE0|nr:Shedu immune nuclease family protein [Sphingobacterium sp. SGR-19]NGM65433.1 DUF4263 domain-containing protein [Sphingobacterium sp. SGR-19]